jgi:hypothetical protein
MGKSTCFLLIKITNDMAAFCLGCIRTDEQRFCWSTVCFIVAHRKRKYGLDCQEGYFIPTRPHKSFWQPSAFRTPFLDAARLTDEVKLVVMGSGDLWWKTTSKWEEFIVQAEITWHAQMVEERRGLWGLGIRKGLDKDNASGMSKSGIYLPDEPSKYMFCEPPIFGEIKFVAKKEAGEDADDPKGESEDEVEEVRRAVMVLDAKLRDLVDTARANQFGIMDHLWGSITRHGLSLDFLDSRLRGLE